MSGMSGMSGMPGLPQSGVRVIVSDPDPRLLVESTRAFLNFGGGDTLEWRTGTRHGIRVHESIHATGPIPGALLLFLALHRRFGLNVGYPPTINRRSLARSTPVATVAQRS